MGKRTDVVIRQDERRMFFRQQGERIGDVLRKAGVERTEPHLLTLCIDGPRPVFDILVDARPVPENRLHQNASTHSPFPLPASLFPIPSSQFRLEPPEALHVPPNLVDGGPTFRVERKRIEYKVVASPLKILLCIRRRNLLVPRRERNHVVESEIRAACGCRRKRSGNDEKPHVHSFAFFISASITSSDSIIYKRHFGHTTRHYRPVGLLAP